MTDYLLQLDGAALLWIQDNVRNEVLTPFFRFITSLGDHGILWVLLSLALFLYKRTRKVGWMAATALFLALLVDNVLLKNLVARARPYEVIPQLQILIEQQWDYSFPSGHTGSSFAAAGVYYKRLPKKYGVPALILAALIGFSRLYVGVHYPSDVLGGMLIGLALAFGVNEIWKRQEERRGKETVK